MITAMFFARVMWAQMSGTYTIGGTNPDFPNVPAAVNALHLIGCNAPVIFDVRPGDHSAIICSFNGLNPAFPATFRSETMNASDVILTFNSIHQSSSLNFENLTIIPLIHYGTLWPYKGVQVSQSISISVDQCIIQGLPIAGQRNGFSVANGNSHSFTNNEFRDLDYAMVYSDVQLGGATTNRHHGTNVIKGNTFDSVLVAIRIAGDVRDSLDISHNIITNAGRGIYVDGSDIAVQRTYIHHNLITGLTDEGIEVRNCSDTFRPIEIYNNMISGGTVTPLMWMSSAGTFNTTVVSGITVRYSDHIRIRNNSLFGGVHLNNSEYIELYNNCLHSDTTLVLYIDRGSSTYQADHNNIHRSDGGFLLTGGNSPWYTDLTTYQSETNRQPNSVSTDPWYTSVTDLHATHPLIQFAGVPIPRVTDDIDGETRHPSTPDIGADEFNASTIPPVAWFAHACDGSLTVAFTDMSVVPGTHHWDFGDLSPPSTESDPIHTFPAPGTFEVMLVVSNAFGVDTMLAPVTLATPTENIVLNNGNLVISDGYAWYQWSYNGTPIAYTDTNAYVPVLSGQYSVTYLDPNGCTPTISLEYTVGIHEQPAGRGLLLHPMPTGDQLTVDGPWTRGAFLDIRIFDTLGRTKYRQQGALTAPLNIDALPGGYYVLHVSDTSGQKWTSAFVVE